MSAQTKLSDDSAKLVSATSLFEFADAIERQEAWRPDSSPRKAHAMEFAQSLRNLIERHASDAVEITEMNLCEQAHLVLAPNRLYRFTVADGCAGCAEMLTACADYSAPTDSDAGEAVDVCAQMRARCSSCGGEGHIHRADGEWLGICDCPYGQALQGKSHPVPTAPASDVPEHWQCEHVAWGKYVDKQTVESCGASEPGAFKLYRCDHALASDGGEWIYFSKDQIAELLRLRAALAERKIDGNLRK